MNGPNQLSPAERAIGLAHEFLAHVWGPSHDLDAIDRLMTDDYQITSGGVRITGREQFKGWVRDFQRVLLDARTEPVESFANAAGDRVVTRWICTGRNNGMFHLPPDGRPVQFSGIAIWAIRDGRLAECWVERAAFEAYQHLSSAPAPS